ncbi:MAG: ribonuclease H-like domain-containing protein, partial [Chloroflexi bacterium]|nr:ribonuclease H-like domain-containing protein [Chloroflexota bacterium]
MSSLADKLKALGVKTGRDIQPPSHDGGHPIESVVAGDFRATPRGDIFVAERVFAENYRRATLIQSQLSILSEWANDPRIAELPIEKFAFLDAETSGLSGGTGTYAFLVGVGRFSGGAFLLRQFFMRDPSEEPAMLEALIDFLAPCKALVSFNGKAFDAPLLAARYALRRIPSPFHGCAHLDLLPLARRLWRDRLPSRALKYLEEHILGVTRASEETPGYEISWLYFDYLRSGDARPLAGVFYHNAMDVTTMTALLERISDLLANPYQEVAHGVDFIALGKLYEDLRRWDEAARLFESGLEAGLGEEDF